MLLVADYSTCISPSFLTCHAARHHRSLVHQYMTDGTQRLGVANDDDDWEPNDAARVILAEMGPPLSFFMAQSEEELQNDLRTKEERGVSFLVLSWLYHDDASSSCNRTFLTRRGITSLGTYW